MADKLKLSTPRGCVVSMNGQTAQLVWNPDFTPRRTKQFSNCQKYVDEAVLKYSSPFVPMETGVLDKSGILGTDVGSGEVQYITPYAAKLYRHPEYSFSTRYGRALHGFFHSWTHFRRRRRTPAGFGPGDRRGLF